jgi:Tol biopolymer transport system component/tRNA A-37 threonylcarbamoyl transferase component Bud32
MASVPPDLKAALADRYDLRSELGRGAMATVYLAEDLRHRRRVAVKVLLPEVAAELGKERFLREIEIAASLAHPHVLPLHDSGEAAGFLYYVMPYVEGESLRDRLRREKQLAVDEALRLGREVADALSYAHGRGVVHRDIKPENILLQSGHAVVADFGIARAVNAAGGERLTRTGMAVGTPAYMSPEQIAGEGDVDGRSDLYSLACVLYEMLGGEPPFTGPTMQSVASQHLSVEPRPITSIRPAVPGEVAAALGRALAKTPADRFNPVGQFAEALRPGRGGEAPTRGARVRPATWVALGVAAVALGVYFVADRLGRDSAEPMPTVGRTVQVTRDPGLEVDPALSPDGEMVAFAAGGAAEMQIRVRAVTGGRSVELSGVGDLHRSPRWSPDGSRVAYQAGDGIWVVPSLGGQPRRVVRIPEVATPFSETAFTALAGHSWSPDGTRIVFAGNYGAEGLYIAEVDGGTDPVPLPAPREPHSPAWSPDGTRIAVASGNAMFAFGGAYFGNAGQSSIWIVPLDGGEPVRVTEDAHLDTSPAWAPDGRHLFWVSDRGGARDVYRIAVDEDGSPTGEPVRLTTGLGAHTIALSPDGRRLAYASFATSSNVWSIPVPEDGPVSIDLARPVTTGNQLIEDVDVTADGEWIVFDSDRDGNSEIYKLRVGTSEPVRLTDHPAGDFGAFWSPDGRRVGFHSLRNGNRDLFLVEADGTGLVQLTADQDHELDADWSPDGSAIVAEVIDADGMEIEGFVIVPLEGGEASARRITAVGDFAAWSPAGETIAYHAADGLRTFPVDGGESRLVVSNEADGSEAFYAAWSPDGGTLYYLARGPEHWMIRAAPADGGPSRILVRLDEPDRQQSRYGFTTDGRTFYLTLGSHASDVWVMDLEGGG